MRVVSKYQITTFPRMLATDTQIVLISVSDLPPCRHGQTVTLVFFGPLIDFATIQSHVQVGAVALGG
jgi:hypothetical protein